jgi:hypothetical protein
VQREQPAGVGFVDRDQLGEVLDAGVSKGDGGDSIRRRTSKRPSVIFSTEGKRPSFENLKTGQKPISAPSACQITPQFMII